MLNFICSIQNPFAKDLSQKRKKHDYCFYYPLTENKFFELDFNKYSPYNLFKFCIDLRWRGSDHAGVGFLIEVYGWTFSAYIRDFRHWDYKSGNWQHN
jgi:hypothetical protein